MKRRNETETAPAKPNVCSRCERGAEAALTDPYMCNGFHVGYYAVGERRVTPSGVVFIADEKGLLREEETGRLKLTSRVA